MKILKAETLANIPVKSPRNIPTIESEYAGTEIVIVMEDGTTACYINEGYMLLDGKYKSLSDFVKEEGVSQEDFDEMYEEEYELTAELSRLYPNISKVLIASL